MLSRSSLLLFLINLFISRLEIPILSLDIITMELRHLYTIIYLRYMLVYSPEPCWLSKSSRLCVLFHFWFSKHLFYRESVHFWHRFLLGFFWILFSRRCPIFLPSPCCRLILLPLRQYAFIIFTLFGSELILTLLYFT